MTTAVESWTMEQEDGRHRGPVERLLDDGAAMKKATVIATELSQTLRLRVGNNIGLGMLAAAKLLVALAAIKGEYPEVLDDCDAVYHALMAVRRSKANPPSPLVHRPRRTAH